MTSKNEWVYQDHYRHRQLADWTRSIILSILGGIDKNIERGQVKN